MTILDCIYGADGYLHFEGFERGCPECGDQRLDEVVQDDQVVTRVCRCGYNEARAESGGPVRVKMRKV